MNPTKTDHADLDLDDSGDALRHAVDAALSSGYETVARTSSTIIVKKCLDIIERYRNDGLTFAQIAQFISEKVAPVTELALKKAYGREVRVRGGAGAPPASAALPPTENTPTPTPGAKKDVAQPTPAPSPAAAAPAPAKTAALPAIPNRELTQTEREAIAVPWFAQHFSGRNPAHVKVEEVSADQLEWLEKLWDVSAPVNPKTGVPYRHKGFTPGGRPTYDKPLMPPKAIPVDGGEDGDFVEIDDDLRAGMLKWAAGLVVSYDFKTDLQTVLPDGKLSAPYPRSSVNGILRGMMRDIARIGRQVQEQKGQISTNP